MNHPVFFFFLPRRVPHLRATLLQTLTLTALTALIRPLALILKPKKYRYCFLGSLIIRPKPYFDY